MALNIQHVLLADDDEDDVTVFRDAFEKKCVGIKFQVVNNGQDLLAVLDRITPPDLVLIDINMPGMDGKSCLQIIRGDKRFEHTTIMMFSVSNNNNDINYCLNNGADYYTVKFGSLRQLRELVDDIASGELKNRFTIGS